MACEYCEDGNRKPLLSDSFEFDSDDGVFVGLANFTDEGEGWKLCVNFDYWIPVSFCLICGRDLRDDDQ